VDVSGFDSNCEIRTVLMDGTMGERLFTGLNTAKYDIIAFLDDDDIFDPGKLSRLMEIFSFNRELCYYHNDTKYVDHAGRTIDYVRLVEKRSRSLNSKNLIFDAKSNLRTIKAALDNRGDFNLSSIAIRKDCYLKYLPLLKQIQGNPDGFFFWTGIISMGQLMIDNKKLTNYRVHEMNNSRQVNFISKAQVLQKQIYTYDLILNFLAVNTDPHKTYEDLKKWISLCKYEYELMLAIFTNSSRASIMILIRRLLSIGVTYSNTLKYRVFLFSIIAVINHDFAQSFYLGIESKSHTAKNKYGDLHL
jgi:glycosyltransferase involved in cell wall biosynthesis